MTRDFQTQDLSSWYVGSEGLHPCTCTRLVAPRHQSTVNSEEPLRVTSFGPATPLPWLCSPPGQQCGQGQSWDGNPDSGRIGRQKGRSVQTQSDEPMRHRLTDGSEFRQRCRQADAGGPESGRHSTGHTDRQSRSPRDPHIPGRPARRLPPTLAPRAAEASWPAGPTKGAGRPGAGSREQGVLAVGGGAGQGPGPPSRCVSRFLLR